MVRRHWRVALATVLAAAGLQLATATPASATPIVGYIKITMNVGQTEPTVLISGALNTTDWACSKPVTYNPLVPYTVRCAMVTNTAQWRCDVLHANSNTYSAGAQLRTSMFCDSSTTPAAQTTTVSGVGGWNYTYGPAGSMVTEFRCTVDNGGVVAPIPNYIGFCGDPPALPLPLPLVG